MLVVLPVFAQTENLPSKPPVPGEVYVHGYYTRKGHYVRGHFRKMPLHKPRRQLVPRHMDSYQKMRRRMQWDVIQRKTAHTHIRVPGVHQKRQRRADPITPPKISG